MLTSNIEMALHFSKICRLCMIQSNDKLLPLFHQEDNLSSKIMTLVPLLKMSLGDGLPAQVCSQCVHQVNTSYNFKLQCETADITLRQLHDCHQPQRIVQRDIENKHKGTCLLTSVKEEVVKAELTIEDHDMCVDSNASSRLYEENGDSDSWTGAMLININTTNRQGNITSHHLGIKADTAKGLKKQQTFVCDVCGKIFKVKKRLQCHMLSHTGEKPFSCDVCGKMFALKECLKIHSRIHTGEKPYCCEECGTCFTQKSGLLTHSKTHTGNKPYSCVECGLKFSRPSHLQSHLVRHTGEKAFSCMQCGRDFGRRDSLKKHIQVHTGHKPHLCTMCGKRFAQSQQLKVHIATHSENKPFMCLECGKTFANNARLKDHLTVHTGKRPFSCQHCTKGFVRREHLKYHLKAVHGKQVINS